MTTVRYPTPTTEATVRTVVSARSRLDERFGTIVSSAPRREGPPSQETIALLAQLKTFADLPEGWDDYGAGSLDDEDIEIGRRVLYALDAPVTITSLSPGPSGELEFAFEYNGCCVTLLADEVDLRWVVRSQTGEPTRHYTTEHLGRSMLEAITEGLERAR